MKLDPRDEIILHRAPTIAEPKFSTRWPMPANSHRFVSAESGLWLEVHRPWLYLLVEIAPAEIALPYGALAATDEYSFGREEMLQVIHQFVDDAREALPNEAAAWAVWDERDQRLHYQLLTPDHASPGGITFPRPVLDEHQTLAIDLHSHGDMKAFWSATDDNDDAGEVKLAVVIGEVNDNKPGIRIRLCAMGVFIDLESPI